MPPTPQASLAFATSTPSHPNCDAALAQEGTLKMHVLTLREKLRDHKCTHPNSDAAFAQAGTLKRHVLTVREKRREAKAEKAALQAMRPFWGAVRFLQLDSTEAARHAAQGWTSVRHKLVASVC